MEPFNSPRPNNQKADYPNFTYPPPNLNYSSSNSHSRSAPHPSSFFVPLSVLSAPFFPCAPPPQPSTSHLHSPPVGVEYDAQQAKTADQLWIKKWLAQRDIQPLPKKTPLHTPQLKDVHSLLVNTSSTIKDLQGSYNQLLAICGYADEAHWVTLLAKINQKKANLSMLLYRVRSLDLAAIKEKLRKRAKKRDWLKRRRSKVRLSQQAEQVRRKMLHQRADAWLADMRLTAEREHREMELRREADAVLGEVTRKQVEAKRQVSLLDALIKLRQVRTQRAAAQASTQDVGVNHAARRFATVIERLRKMWMAQLKEYATEERGLRAMLHASAAQKSNDRCKRVKSNIDLWHKVIFGESALNGPVKLDVNQLLTIRMEWDKYVVHFGANTPMVSTIPVGWVLPQEPSSQKWRPYCVAYDEDE